MADWTDWADGSDLAGVSRSTSPLTSAGYDPDDLRANPQLRQQVMASIGSPYGLSAIQPPAAKPTIGPAAPSVTPSAGGSSPRPMTSSTGAPPGAGTVLPARPPSSGSGQRNTELDAMGHQGLQGGLETAGFAKRLSEQLAAGDPRIEQEDQQVLKDSIPTQLNDASGKMLPQYKPTGWQKFGRGVKDVALGLVEGGIPGAIAGGIDPNLVRGGTDYNAPNATYEAAETARQGRLTNDTAQATNLKELWKQRSDALTGALKGAETAATAYGNVARDEGSLNKPPAAVKTPGSYMINGQPGYAHFDPQQGWIDDTPGANFGKPVQGNLVPYEKPGEAHPQSVLIDGKPGFAVPVEGKGWQDLTGQPIKGRVSPVPTRAEGASGAGIPGTGGNPGLQGDAYLSTLPPELAATVRAIGEGRMAPPSAGNRSKAAMVVLNAVNQAYPAYDATQYPTYAAARKTFTSGPIGTAINSFNTALQHLNRMEGNIPSENTSFETLNTIANKLAPSGSQRGIDIGKFKTDANAVSNEVQKAYKGGVVTQDEYNQMLNLLNPNGSPAQIRSNLNELRQLLHGKLESYAAQWASQGPPGMKMPAPGLAPSGEFDWGKGFHPLPGGKQ